MVGSIVVVVALLHFVCDLKATQINVQYCLIWEFMFYELELAHNAAETIKNICWVKGEGAFDHSTTTKWLAGCLGFMAYQPL